jgi:hypothetical protein
MTLPRQIPAIRTYINKKDGIMRYEVKTRIRVPEHQEGVRVL